VSMKDATSPLGLNMGQIVMGRNGYVSVLSVR